MYLCRPVRVWSRIHGMKNVPNEPDRRQEVYGEWRLGYATEGNLDWIGSQLVSGCLDGVVADKFNGWPGASLGALRNVLRSARALVVPHPEKVDISLVDDMEHLECLSLGRGGKGFSLKKLKRLAYLRFGPWVPDFPDTNAIAVLAVYGIRTGGGLPGFPHLKRLHVYGGNITTLGWLSQSPQLEYVNISNMRALESVAGLQQARGLKVLRAENCKKVRDWEALAVCDMLEVFSLFKCGNIKSIAWLQRCRNVREVVMLETFVDDGDMGGLRSVPQVFFTDRVHYSVKLKELQR